MLSSKQRSAEGRGILSEGAKKVGGERVAPDHPLPHKERLLSPEKSGANVKDKNE
jgi:hypothetical protein